MKGVGDFGGDLQNLGQCLTRKASAERLVNVIKRHTAGQAFENEGDSEPGCHELPASRPVWGSIPDTGGVGLTSVIEENRISSGLNHFAGNWPASEIEREIPRDIAAKVAERHSPRRLRIPETALGLGKRIRQRADPSAAGI